jgi:serine/threonine-protein kinase
VPICFALGQVDVGFEWMTRCCQDRCFEMLSIKVDPRFESLQADPRFAAVLKQIGLDQAPERVITC